MRRLNKRKKNFGMNALISKEKRDDIRDRLKKIIFKSNEKSTPKLPEVKANRTIAQITGVYTNASSTNVSHSTSMNSFEKEYKEFIDNLKKQKAEKEKNKVVSAPKVEVKVETTPVFELPPEEPKQVETVIEKTIDDLKTVLDKVDTAVIETPVEEKRPRRRRRKKNTDTEIA